MGLKLEEIRSLIKKALPDAEIKIEDLAGDEMAGREFTILVCDALFL